MKRVRIEGLRALDKALGQLKPSTGKNVLRRAGREGLAVFDANWRERAPHLHGDLEESGSVGSKVARRDRRQSTVEVYAGPGRNPQAIQQEFGNEFHPPQPFVRPAWDETKDQVLDRVAKALGDEIARTAKRMAKRAR